MNFAIIGTNFVTDWFLEAGDLCQDFNLVAVYSRTLTRAKEYVEKYGAKYAFDDLESLCNCNDVDAVYLASPTSCHYEQAIKLMSAGKHILCEKPIASNLKELEAMLKCSKENNVVLLEAIRPEFSPAFESIKNMLPQLGTIRHAYFTFSKYSSRYDRFLSGETVNAFNLELSNCALTDLGCYCILIMLKLFGNPKDMQSNTVKLKNGFDALGSFIADYGDMTVTTSYSKVSDTHNFCEIQGEKGTLKFRDPSTLNEVYLIKRGQPPEQIVTPMVEQDMLYELQAFINYVRNSDGLDAHQHYSIETMKVMDTIRKQCNIVFPADKIK
jgi:predicted dehydrogenase